MSVSAAKVALVFYGLECCDLSLSGFPDSHFILSVLSPFKDESEISCVQLLFKRLHYLPSTTKSSSFSKLLFFHFFLQPLSARPSHPLLRAPTPDLVLPNSPLTAARARAVM